MALSAVSALAASAGAAHPQQPPEIEAERGRGHRIEPIRRIDQRHRFAARHAAASA